MAGMRLGRGGSFRKRVGALFWGRGWWVRGGRRGHVVYQFRFGRALTDSCIHKRTINFDPSQCASGYYPALIKDASSPAEDPPPHERKYGGNKPRQEIGSASTSLLFHMQRLFLHLLLATELLLHFLDHKPFVVFETLLHMHLELDDVVQHLLDLGVELFSQGVGAEGQLLVSADMALANCLYQKVFALVCVGRL